MSARSANCPKPLTERKQTFPRDAPRRSQTTLAKELKGLTTLAQGCRGLTESSSRQPHRLRRPGLRASCFDSRSGANVGLSNDSKNEARVGKMGLGIRWVFFLLLNHQYRNKNTLLPPANQTKTERKKKKGKKDEKRKKEKGTLQNLTYKPFLIKHQDTQTSTKTKTKIVLISLLFSPSFSSAFFFFFFLVLHRTALSWYL